LLQIMEQIQISKETLARLLKYRKGFEPADDVVNEVLDLAEIAKQAQESPLGMVGVIVVPRATKPKPASTQELHEAIKTVLTAHDGQEATNQQVFVEAAQLLPEASQHVNWKAHVSWAASDLRQKGLLKNGHDHGKWGVWRLVDPDLPPM
jgi:hypothetical protein